MEAILVVIKKEEKEVSLISEADLPPCSSPLLEGIAVQMTLFTFKMPLCKFLINLFSGPCYSPGLW